MEVTNGAQKVTVSGNTLTGIDNDSTTNYTKGIGMQADDARVDTHTISITGNTIAECGAPISATPASFGNMYNVKITDNTINSNGGTSAFSRFQYVDNLTFTDNVYTMSSVDGEYGVKFEDCDGLKVNNNQFLNQFDGQATGDTDYPILFTTAGTVTLNYLQCRGNRFTAAALVNSSPAVNGYARYSGDPGRYALGTSAIFDLGDNPGGKIQYMDANNGNPSLVFGDTIVLNDGHATGSTVTDIDNGWIGAKITFRFNTAKTTLTHTQGQLELDNGRDFTATRRSIITFKMISDGIWSEVSRTTGA